MKYDNVPVFRSGTDEYDPAFIIGRATVVTEDNEARTTIIIETSNSYFNQFLEQVDLKSLMLNGAGSIKNGEHALDVIPEEEYERRRRERTENNQ